MGRASAGGREEAEAAAGARKLTPTLTPERDGSLKRWRETGEEKIVHSGDFLPVEWLLTTR